MTIGLVRTPTNASLLLHMTIVAVLLLGLVTGWGAGSGAADHGLLIGAAIVLVAKFFGKRRDDADEDEQGGHAATRFMLKAMNTGDFDRVDEIVGADFRAFANGYPLASEETDSGPSLVETMLGYWRDAIPDVRWELYDEVVQKQEDESVLIALRVVSRGTFDGEEHETEIGVFGRVVDDQLTEWRMVVDMTVFNVFRIAIGLPPIE